MAVGRCQFATIATFRDFGVRFALAAFFHSTIPIRQFYGHPMDGNAFCSIFTEKITRIVQLTPSDMKSFNGINEKR